jgi:hypothetical protein
MESHVLPTIMNYHLGIETNKGLNAGDKTRMEADPDWADNYEGYVRLGLDAAKLWVAIARGRATTENLYSGHWDSWTHAPEPLEDLRSRWSFRRRTRPWPPSTTTRRRSPTARGCVATALQ